MSEELTIKKIALEKLNRILNPNFETKFISTLLVSGTMLLGYQQIIQLASSFELITENLYFKLSLNSEIEYLLIIIGALMVFSAFTLYRRKYKGSENRVEKYKTLKEAAVAIQPLIDDNRRIFINFGPNSSSGSFGVIRQELNIWEETKRSQIIPNNNKIFKILKHIVHLDDIEIKIVEKMKSHIQAFKVHCDNPKEDYSKHQFPLEFSNLIFEYVSEKNKGFSNKEKYKTWIIESLKKYNLSVERVFLYGSALYGQEVNDVDFIIKTMLLPIV